MHPAVVIRFSAAGQGEPKMGSGSLFIQLIALRMQLTNTSAEACCLDTAAPDSDDEAVQEQ